jgi:hypothetical protein
MACPQQQLQSQPSCGNFTAAASFHSPPPQQQPQPCQQQQQQPQPCSGGALGQYGQSYSSENLDFNNLPPVFPQQQQYQYGGYGQPQQSQQLDVNDPALQQQIEQIVASLVDNRRPMFRRQVITVPSQQPGRVACVNRRLPTPPPDVIERITVIKPPRDIINLCIEKPCQPGPCFQEKTVCGKVLKIDLKIYFFRLNLLNILFFQPRKPLIQPRVVQVAPRSNQFCPRKIHVILIF